VHNSKPEESICRIREKRKKERAVAQEHPQHPKHETIHEEM
jgi:hypothetical protein